MKVRSSHSWSLAALTAFIVICSACSRDLTLPADDRTGSIQGRLVIEVPGRRTPQPAAGASIRLARSSLQTTADVDGRFSLSGSFSSEATLECGIDLDKDGQEERISLVPLRGALPGRDLFLGDVVLGPRSTVTGKALRAELADQRTGHGGLVVVVPDQPAAALTFDDGSFVLEGLPQGTLQVVAVRGSASSSATVTLSSGQEFTLSTLKVPEPATSTPPITIAGRATNAEANGVDAVTITIAAGSFRQKATSAADGTFTASLPPGVYSIGFEKMGFTTVRLANVVALQNIALGDVSLATGASQPFEPDGGFLDAGLVAGPGELVEVLVRAPTPSPVEPGSDFTLEAQVVGGQPPLRFRWEKDDGGVIDEGIGAGSVTITAPSTCPEVVDVSVIATDGRGSRRSTKVQVPVSTPAEVMLDQGLVVRAGESVMVNSSVHQQECRQGGYEYVWRSVAPPGITVSRPDGGSDEARLVTIDSNFEKDQVFSLSLEVFDAVKARSNTAVSNIQVLGRFSMADAGRGGPDASIQLDGGFQLPTNDGGIPVVMALDGFGVSAGMATQSASMTLYFSQAIDVSSVPGAIVTATVGTIEARVINGFAVTSNPGMLQAWLYDRLSNGDVYTLSVANLRSFSGVPFSVEITGLVAQSRAEYPWLQPVAPLASGASLVPSLGPTFHLVWVEPDAGVRDTGELAPRYCQFDAGCFAPTSFSNPIGTAFGPPVGRRVYLTPSASYYWFGSQVARLPIFSPAATFSTLPSFSGTPYTDGDRLCSANKTPGTVERVCYDPTASMWNVGFWNATVSNPLTDAYAAASGAYVFTAVGTDAGVEGFVVLDGGLTMPLSKYPVGVPLGSSRLRVAQADKRSIVAVHSPTSGNGGEVWLASWSEPSAAPVSGPTFSPANGVDLLVRGGMVYLLITSFDGVELKAASLQNPGMLFWQSVSLSEPLTFHPPPCLPHEPELVGDEQGLYATWRDVCPTQDVIVTRQIR